MKVSFEGIGEQLISFAAAGDVKGQFVRMSGNGCVSACASGEGFLGLCIAENGGFADVLSHGYVKCPYTGTSPAVGYGRLCADAAGKVKVSSSGREYLILEVDSASCTLGVIR